MYNVHINNIVNNITISTSKSFPIFVFAYFMLAYRYRYDIVDINMRGTTTLKIRYLRKIVIMEFHDF